MQEAYDIPSPVGVLRLRPERDEDQDFRYRLFCDSRQPEFALLLAAPDFERIMRFQYRAQTVSYRAEFPAARFDIIELSGEPIGRIIVDRPGGMLHIVDQAIAPEWRNRGIGTAIMRALMDEAQTAGLPVRLEVSSANDPSLRLYQRLGFVPIETVALYMRLEWRALATQSERPC
ncbi:Ribosomal protein S18 acetylase RimI [Rhizobiales bacterium GAS113]|jgi:ribosomal protein S18 acetylase RimI-like enzyme|nr:Ribosomal protein S18 acetylase RimI [Rhizobiales bacterium GAS113]